MYSRALIIQLIFVLVFVINDVSCRSNFFQPPQACQNEPESNQENCLKNFCLTNNRKFVCQAYDCKRNNGGDGIVAKLSKLRCIENACEINTTEPVCVELNQCSAKKKTEGFFSYIGCIMTLFQAS